MKNKKHIKAIYEILQQQAEINRMHGNAIADLKFQNKELINEQLRLMTRIKHLETMERK